MTSLRRTVGRIRSLVSRDRSDVVPDGPATGLQLGPEPASADYSAAGNEVPVQEAIVDGLSPGSVFVDVGANVGFFSLLAARLVGPTGRVIALEPIPDNVAAIAANAQRNALTVDVVEAAATDHHGGEVALWLSGHPGGASISGDDVPPDLTGRLDVQAVSLDGLADEGRLPPPDVIKIDVEGAEVAVLRGARRVLERYHPRLVVEIDDATTDALAAKRAAVTGELEVLGYRVATLPSSYPGGAWHVEHLLAVVGSRAR